MVSERERLLELRKHAGFRLFANSNCNTVRIIGEFPKGSKEWARRAELTLADIWVELPQEQRDKWTAHGNAFARERAAAKVEANVHKQFGRYLEEHGLLQGVKDVREQNFRAAAIIKEVLADPQKRAAAYAEMEVWAAEKAAAIRAGLIPV